MKILEQIDPSTRIVLKFHLAALENDIICLQRKKSFWGWKTCAWIYPSVVSEKTWGYVKEWLFWEEAGNRKPKNFQIAMKILANNK